MADVQQAWDEGGSQQKDPEKSETDWNQQGGYALMCILC